MAKERSRERDSELRKRAEVILAQDPQAIRSMATTDIQKLIHELNVHQIELEMQNAEFRRVQLELQEARDKYLDLYDFAPTGYFTLDRNSLIVDVNLVGSTLLGSEKPRLIGTKFTASIPPDFQDAFYFHYREVLKAGIKGNCELKMLKADGTPFHAQLISVPVPKKDGNINHCRTSVIDITERKQAVEALKRSEELFRTLVATSPDGIAMVGTDGLISYASQKIMELFGYQDESEIVGGSPMDWIATEGRERARTNIGKILKGESSGHNQYRMLKKDGTSFWGEINSSAMNDVKGNPIGMVAIIRDITERKRAEEALQDSLAKLQKAMEGTVNAMALTSEMRDPYTAGHQRRVSRLACAIAEEMALRDWQVQGIRMAGLLHDIGKIAVPSEILSRPGKLTEMEFNLVKTHALVGSDILKTIDFPWPIAQMVRQHHERIDGSGYPLGLKGEDILLEARILAVADVVEAMTSHRPFRLAHGIEKALQELGEKKGILYDPKVADVCIKLFTDKKFAVE